MKVSITQWDNGMVSDPRIPGEAISSISSGFDILTNPRKMTPYRQSVTGDAGASTNKIQNFQIALRTGTTYSLYGLGVVSGTGRAEIKYKDLTTGGANDLDDSGWSTPTNNASSVGSTAFDLFVYYKTLGLIIGARANTHLWAFSPSGSAFNDSWQSLSYTNISQGLVVGADLYIPYDNKIGVYSGGLWYPNVFSINDTEYITSICVMGNFIAIAGVSLSGVGQSTVYLWDKKSDLATERIKWGEGSLMVLEELEGYLIGISLNGGNSTKFENEISFKYYNSNYGAVEFNKLVCDQSTNTVLKKAKQLTDGRLYFMLTATLDGTTLNGVWSVGRSSPSQPFSVQHEQKVTNDTAISGVLNNFIKVGDFMFQSYQDAGNFGMSKTNSTELYTGNTATRITQKNPNIPKEDKYALKQLIGVALSYEPLETNASIQLEYRVDNGTWSTVFTRTTEGEVYYEKQKATEEFTKGYEYQFRIKSTGSTHASVPTGLYYKYKTIPNLMS